MNLFQQIEEVVATIPGWCSPQKAVALAASVVALRPSATCEIGVYGGRGTVALALAHKHNRFGRCIAIDPWSGEVAAEGYTPKHHEWWGSQPLEKIYQDFLRLIGGLDLGGHIEIIRAKSDDYEPSEPISVFHLDGQHTMQALKDTQRYAPHVPVGGLMFCDDTEWEGGGPKAGVEWLLANGWKQIYTMDTGAMFQRVI